MRLTPIPALRESLEPKTGLDSQVEPILPNPVSLQARRERHSFSSANSK